MIASPASTLSRNLNEGNLRGSSVSDFSSVVNVLETFSRTQRCYFWEKLDIAWQFLKSLPAQMIFLQFNGPCFLKCSLSSISLVEVPASSSITDSLYQREWSGAFASACKNNELASECKSLIKYEENLHFTTFIFLVYPNYYHEHSSSNQMCKFSVKLISKQ